MKRIDKFERNLIINGNMDLWQRGNLIASTGDSYLADRFRCFSSDNIGVQRSTDVPPIIESGFQSTYSLEVFRTFAHPNGAGDFASINYAVEGFDFTNVFQRKALIKFWVKATVPGTYSLGLADSNSPTISRVSEYEIFQADTWEEKSILVDFKNNGFSNFTTAIGCSIKFALVVGSTYQTSTLDQWQAGNFLGSTNQVLALPASSSFKLAQVQLIAVEDAFRPADVDIPFRRAGKTIGEEIAFAQRYYEKSYSLSVTPGTPQAGIFGGSTFNTRGSTFHRQHSKFQTSKRVNIPTITAYGWQSGAVNVVQRDSGVAVAVGSVTSNESGFTIQTGAGLVLDGEYSFHWTADAEI